MGMETSAHHAPPSLEVDAGPGPRTDAGPGDHADVHRPGRYRAAAGALSLGAFGFGTAQALPIGLLPEMATDLQRSLSDAGWLVTTYAAVVLAVSVPLTALTRRVPRRRLFGVLFTVFAASAVGCATAATFEALLTASVVMALAQALFWSVVVPTAAGSAPPGRRSWAVAAVFTGSSLAPVVGLPAATWLGQQAGWRSAFLALAVLAAAIGVAVVVGLPSVARHEEPLRTGEQPDGRRYAVLIAVTVLTVTAMFIPYTYVTAHLVDVVGMAPEAVGPVLFGAGLAGVVGAVGGGALLQRRPHAQLVVSLAVMLAAAVVLLVAGRGPAGAVVAFVLFSLAASSFATGLGARVLLVAPGSTDLASAGTSAAYNAGVATGAWIGGLIVAGAGAHATALGAVAFAASGLLLMLGENRFRGADPSPFTPAPRTRTLP